MRTADFLSARSLLGIALLSGSLWLMSPGAARAADLLPNLKALPATDISVGRNFAGDLAIRFSASSWNAGAGPLELIAGEVVRDRQNVYQRIYADDGSYHDELAGSFVWHQTHNHFHFEDYALYTLQPTWTKSSRTGTKTSFCIMDTFLQDRSLPGAPRSAVYANCGNSAQGMSVGWGDKYGAQLPGQEISLAKLKDGDYRLYIEADPKNRLIETDETDNVSCMLLHISITNETFDVLNPDSCDAPSPPSGGGVTVTAIDPTAAPAGTTFEMTITGTGFADGMTVTFDNGTSYKPVASNVIVDSSTQIRATVTIRNKGKSKDDNVWDVHVGDGVLIDAFTVL